MVVTRKRKEILYQSAPVWKRLVAFLLDMLILEFFVFSHFEALVTKLSLGNTFSPLVLSQFTVLVFVMSMFVLLYFVVLECWLGQTLGYMALSIRLVGDLSFWRVLVSNLSFLPVFPFVLLWLLDPLMILFSSTHQRFMHVLLGLHVIDEVPLAGLDGVL